MLFTNIRYKRFLGKTANADSERALSTKGKHQVKTLDPFVPRNPMFSEYIAILSNLGCSFRPAKPFEMTGDTDSSMVFLKKEQAVSFLDSSFVKPQFVEYLFRFIFIFSNLSGSGT